MLSQPGRGLFSPAFSLPACCLEIRLPHHQTATHATIARLTPFSWAFFLFFPALRSLEKKKTQKNNVISPQPNNTRLMGCCAVARFP